MQTSRRTCSTLQPDHVQRALEIGHRARARACRCRTSTIPSPAATAHALQCGTPGHGSGRRRRQTPGSTPLAAADLALAGVGGHRRQHLMHRVGRQPRARTRRNDDGHRRRPDGRDHARRARVLRGAGARRRDARVATTPADAAGRYPRRDRPGARPTEMRRLLRRAVRPPSPTGASRSSRRLVEGDGAAVRWRARGDLRRAGQLHGLRAQRRARRRRGHRRRCGPRRADRRATTPT